ncbi:MAG: sel1 repeat family protein [Pseudomonadales bacterium]|nr:sel1 repeat family protein [Pseudomonadales bacterium]
MGLSLLLVWSVACGDPSFTPHREVSADWGNRVSQFEKGLAFQEGFDVEKDLKKALFWYEAAATQTNHIAKPNQTIIDIADRYGVMIRDMNALNPKMDVDNLKTKEKIIIPGYAKAMYHAGALHESGNGGIKQDYAMAAKWYHSGAEAGDELAQFSYAYALEKGQGTEVDLKKAANWYRLSAEKGVGSAQQNLAQLYFRGIGVDKNLSEAYRWYSLAGKYLKYDAGGDGETAAQDKAQLQKAIKTCGESIASEEKVRMDRLIESFEPAR